jgi:hypothetical protein
VSITIEPAQVVFVHREPPDFSINKADTLRITHLTISLQEVPEWLVEATPYCLNESQDLKFCQRSFTNVSGSS